MESVGPGSPRGPFIVPPAPAHILLEAGKDPSFPHITVSVSAHCGVANSPASPGRGSWIELEDGGWCCCWGDA